MCSFFFSDQIVWNFEVWAERKSILRKIVQIKIKRRKKCVSEFTSFVLYFPTRRNRDLFTPRCGQESSVIGQCLAKSVSTGFTTACLHQ